MGHVSPLRYHGGKAGISDFPAAAVDRNRLERCECLEPHAVGAGAALRGIVSEVRLSDAGLRVHAFRRSRVQSVPLTIGERKKQREICKRSRERDFFDPGFAALRANRCNTSEFPTGPISGQAGSRRVRFSRQTPSGRIERLSGLRDGIRLHDAVAFLKTTLPKGRKRQRRRPPCVDDVHRLCRCMPNDHEKPARRFLAQNRRGGSCRTTTAASSENRVGTASNFCRRFITPCSANGLRKSSSSPRRTFPCLRTIAEAALGSGSRRSPKRTMS